jgi:hypothetical protein
MSEAPKRKPLVLKGLSKGVRLAPESEVPAPQDVALSIAPSSEEVGVVARTFFKKPSAVPVSGKVSVAPPTVVPARAPGPFLGKPAAGPVPVVPVPAPALAAPVLQPEPAAPVEEEESIWKDIFNESEFADLAEAIEREKTKNPYSTPELSEGYIPQTRRAFSQFIRETYSQFTLPPLPSEPDYDACMKMGAQGAQTAEIYQYQQFVRDYMSFSTPYRGVLVYHGLGSGKTCTAIAAAEALFSRGNRKIIVMTPYSLRKNFISEISFCGFRHFRLLNHWISFPNDPVRSSMINIFARNILNIPESHLKKAKRIWIPDFSKPQNYQAPPNTSAEELDNYLTSEEQTEVREQIQAILVFDPAKKKDGRIWFINYNGITSTKLKQLACMNPANAFDNAVIVVDEIHNLIRLMQGTIEPYLVELKGVRRKISYEPITWEKWSPKLCGKDMSYKRGYLLYRLLTGAQNSKIIGLSGTPLINFPEELGILSNVLHGYLHILEGRVQKTGSSDADIAVQKQIEELAEESIYVDFYRVTIDDTSIRFVMTMLPEGIRKIATYEPGVERIPLDEPTVSFGERVETLKQAITAKGLRLIGTLRIDSEPLLPPVGEQFKNIFIGSDGASVKNKAVLIKRLTGLISYYKGSRKDLMPRVALDTIVRVPFSAYQQSQYSKVRLEEIDIEKKDEDKKKREGQQGIGTGKLGELWAEIYEIKNMSQSSNYRMGSRQACNFTFPPGIARPRPKNKKEALQETGKDVKDIVDSKPEHTEIPGEPDDLGSILEEEDREEMEADAEDNAVEAAEAPDGKEGKEADGLELVPEKVDPALAALTEEEKLCRIPRLPGETYIAASDRAKKCLATVGVSKMKIGGKEGLAEVSPKYLAILEKIMKGKGSSLVYSQFLTMEGIGIFTVAMEANGFDPIEIETAGGVRFSERTIASLQKGPAANQPRFITFTGNEPEEVRRYAVDFFNAKFSSLPRSMADILVQAGFADNKRGELCRAFCITSAGAEGLSLKNVRMVHIMEPYWNDVRTSQVKGRAVRICSHMDLPPEERTVEIYTYITVFGPEAQTTKADPFKIDETIRRRDSLTIEEAMAANLPLPKGAQEYVMTSDERLFVISERKKTLIQNLQNLMKASAVDCQLNYAENNDGTFTCALFDKTGDFMYYPSLQQDIEETGTRYRNDMFEKKTVVPGPAAPAGAEAPRKSFPVVIRKEPYLLVEKRNPDTKQLEKYEIYKREDSSFQTAVGEVAVDPATGKPKAGTARFYG